MENDNKFIVGIVNGKEWILQCDQLPGSLRKRTSIVMELLKGYGLLDKMETISPRMASFEELSSFHSKDYLDFCDKLSKSTDIEKFTFTLDETLKSALSSIEDEYGVEYDCPIVPNMSALISWLAGGSLSAAQWLTGGYGKRAINWGGGWHHAQRDKASGFCYVNDIVIAIHELRRTYDKVLYVDLDIHHGDGVENAFAFTKKVFTFSVHKYSPGFFPGSGNSDEIGFGIAKYFCLNVPLKDGVDDVQFYSVFARIFQKLTSSFQPDAFVVQCGADCLTGDPLGGFNLTPIGMEKCIKLILQSAGIRPCLFLGGGGYNRPNVARYWAKITSSIIADAHNSSDLLSEDIPENDYFSLYGPSFELGIDKSLRPSEHTMEELRKITDSAVGIC